MEPDVGSGIVVILVVVRMADEARAVDAIEFPTQFTVLTSSFFSDHFLLLTTINHSRLLRAGPGLTSARELRPNISQGSDFPHYDSPTLPGNHSIASTGHHPTLSANSIRPSRTRI